MKKLSVKWKIFSYLICFCALLLLVLWLFQTVLLDKFYRAIKVMEIKSDAKVITKTIDDSTLLDSTIIEVSKEHDCYVEIAKIDGTILQSYGDMKNRLPLDKKATMISKIQDGYYLEYFNNDFMKINRFEFEPNKKGFESIVYLKKIDDKIIILNAVITPVNATVMTLRYQLYGVTAIMIILSIVLALLISKRVSKPIEELNKQAKSLAVGNYNVNFKDRGYREISELSNTLNIAATELKKVEDLRRELMANISHDLRTPLSLIYGYAEIMHDFPEDVTPEHTETIMNEIQRLSSLVKDILDISNFEAGTQQLNRKTFNLTESFRKSVSSITEFVKKDGYIIDFMADKDITIKADEIKLTQCFYNLLINAINYSGVDKHVEVRQKATNKSVIIEITDTGEGIAEEDIQFIWDRYYKIDKNHKRPITGTGLGLSIVKKIVELHGGNYGVRSKVGEGSTFWFEIKR